MNIHATGPGGGDHDHAAVNCYCSSRDPDGSILLLRWWRCIFLMTILSPWDRGVVVQYHRTLRTGMIRTLAGTSCPDQERTLPANRKPRTFLHGVSKKAMATKHNWKQNTFVKINQIFHECTLMHGHCENNPCTMVSFISAVQ
jgi:hypothetical protein